MEFKMLEEEARDHSRLARFLQEKENREFEEAKEVIHRLFPQERVTKDWAKGYHIQDGISIGKSIWGVEGEFNSQLLNQESNDSFRLRKTSSIHICYCGCGNMNFFEDYWIQALEYNDEQRMLKGNGWLERGILSRGLDIDRYTWVKIDPDFYENIPGAIDEWLKMRFEAKIRN